jgi:hypothetical protein
MCLKVARWFAFFLVAVFTCAGTAHATDISGTIATTLTIMDNSRLVGDVTCTVTGAPCITFGASGLSLDLNGYSITGQGDPVTACGGGGGTGGEVGIVVNSLQNIAIRGLGLVQRFRSLGIQLLSSSGVTVTGVTMSTNCLSGVIVVGGSDNLLENNVSERNGNGVNPCGGI